MTIATIAHIDVHLHEFCTGRCQFIPSPCGEPCAASNSRRRRPEHGRHRDFVGSDQVTLETVVLVAVAAGILAFLIRANIEYWRLPPAHRKRYLTRW